MKHIDKYKVFERNLLVPRNIEGRKEKQLQMIYKQLQQEVIDDDLYFGKIPITNFGKVKIINGDLYLNKNKTLKSLGNLESVYGYLSLEYTNVEDLGNLEYVKDWLYLSNSNIEDLGNLKSCNRLVLTKDTKVPEEQYKKFNYQIR